ncbi:MAG: GNAT family N-acetyltransferase [Anaerolineae bacterium]|nr:GNAT family N-acetyltransferase [Anaerolineae bacterium]
MPESVEAVKKFNLKLRPAQKSDCQLIWEWANDPEARKVSFSSDFIPWEQHLAWFQQKLTDSKVLLFLALNEQDIPIGQVRYEIDEKNEAVISISVAKEFRGQGYGPALIERGGEKLFALTRVGVVHAYVTPPNHASVRAFITAGFEQVGTTVIKGQQALHFVWQRDRNSQ